jgi:hypothetical protein
VQASLQFGAHISEEALENYAFNRLPEIDVEAVEEHLLVCARCQEALGQIDEYIALMKEAAVAPNVPVVAEPVRIPRLYVVGGAAAAVLALGLYLPRGAPLPAENVTLAAFRGVEMAHIHAGRPADFRIEIPELEPGLYRIEVVNETGRVLWTGTGPAANGQISVHEPKALRPGVYWVRLYSPEGKILREFGLHGD